jgi:hypothetical protein
MVYRGSERVNPVACADWFSGGSRRSRASEIPDGGSLRILYKLPNQSFHSVCSNIIPQSIRIQSGSLRAFVLSAVDSVARGIHNTVSRTSGSLAEWAPAHSVECSVLICLRCRPNADMHRVEPRESELFQGKILVLLFER